MMRKILWSVVVGLGLSCTVAGVAQEQGYWRAKSSTAKSVTGDVGLSGEKISINFATYWIAQIRTLTPAELGGAFGADVNAAGSGNLYRLSIPGDKKFLHKSTLCASADTQWMATYVNGRELQVAFFSGSKPPAMTVEEMTNATDLCGVFSYVR
jgi:hypothetical protein